MNTIKKFALSLLAMITIAVSCAKIEGDYHTSRIPVNDNMEYAIMFDNGASLTKASLNTLSGTGYDEFELFIWNSNNDTIMSPYTVKASAASAYRYDNVTGQELKYFSNTADYYDFIGVIPSGHKTTLTDGAVKVDTLKSFTVDDSRVTGSLTAESPEEFLWAYKRVAKANYGSTVTLPFQHGNAVLYLGFSSDRDDTKLLDYVPGTAGSPAVNDTTDTWINLRRSSNCDGSPTRTSTDGGSTYVDNYEIPAALVAEIKSYYSINNGTAGDYDLHMGASVWPSAEIRQLRIVKDIPAAYRMPVETTSGDVLVFFNALKYLEDNGYKMTYRISGGKPDIFNYPIIDLFVNGTTYTVVGFNFGVSTVYDASVPGNVSALNYTINVTPAVPGTDPIEGVRVFSADSLGVNNLPTDSLYCVHRPHSVRADATVDADGMVYSNRVTSDEVITFSLPTTTTLSSSPVWSATTFYALPGDENLNFFVVKLSYTYNGVTAYDVRVPIKLPDGGLQEGKYYKYEIYITSTSNGTNSTDEATDEKDEVLIEGLPPIVVDLSVTDYTLGADQKITI